MASTYVKLLQFSQEGATDGQVITWDNTLTKWKPGTPTGSSSGISGAVQFSGGSGLFSSDASNFFYNDTTNQLQMAGGTTYGVLISGSNGGLDASPSASITGFWNAFRTNANATGTVNMFLNNTNTSSGTAHSKLTISTTTAGGDPYIYLSTGNESGYVIGMDNSASDKLFIGLGADPSTMSTPNITLDSVGTGFMQTSPTAYIHPGPGTATAGTAPIKLSSGTALTTPENGAIEYHSSHLYFTIGSTRYQLDQQSGTLSDGDKGDITVSSSGAVWTIDNDVVTYAKMQNVSATNRLLGRSTAGSGDVEEITVGGDLTQSGSTFTVTTATTSTAGKVELATAAETTAADSSRAVTGRGLADSIYGARIIHLQVSDPLGSAITTGDGKVYFRVDAYASGMNLVAVGASVGTVSSSGTPTIQLRRVRSGASADMLSTRITIDVSEVDSSTAASASVINTSNDDVLEGDQIYVDIDVAGTGTKGLNITMVFQTP
jgi:hypothetical protein